jgi:hypothetical protein
MSILNYLILAPSVNSLLITGLLLLVVLIILMRNFRNFVSLDFYKKMSLISLIIIAIGIHGLIHLGVETNYGLNPYNIIL